MNRLTLLLLFLPFLCVAQNDPAGARSAGMANAGLTFTDVWSLYQNQAGIAFLDHTEAAAFYENRFLVSELAYAGFAAATPLGNGAIGLSYSGFGFSVYRESKVGLAYGLKLTERLSAGVQLNYQQVRITASDYGSKGLLSAEVGFLMKISDKVTAAAHIYNPTRTQINEFDDERLPTAIRLGVGYQVSTEVLLTAEAEKDIDRDATVRAGIEYHPVEVLYVRLGAGSGPGLFAFGLGLQFEHFRFDLASTYHSVLGYSPQASLTYRRSTK